MHRRERSPQSGPTIFYAGAYWWRPNFDAAHMLIDEIYPRLRERYPGTRLMLVGRNPTPQMEAAARADEQIVVTGEVDDIRPYLAQSHVAAVPLLIGGGMRSKIIEAFAAGLPVVSTTKGAEGIEVVDGRELLVRDGVPAIVAGIAELWENPDDAARARGTRFRVRPARLQYGSDGTAHACRAATRDSVRSGAGPKRDQRARHAAHSHVVLDDGRASIRRRRARRKACGAIFSRSRSSVRSRCSRCATTKAARRRYPASSGGTTSKNRNGMPSILARRSAASRSARSASFRRPNIRSSTARSRSGANRELRAFIDEFKPTLAVVDHWLNAVIPSPLLHRDFPVVVASHDVEWQLVRDLTAGKAPLLEAPARGCRDLPPAPDGIGIIS